MLSRTGWAVGLPAACALVGLGAAPAGAQYSKGFEWNRGADWTPGAAPGSGEHNPGPDAKGAAVWAYEAASGGGLGSGDPWFEGPTRMLSWDDLWWESGEGAWTLGDDKNPPIFANRMTHNLGTANHGNVPVVRWNNPAGDAALLDIVGSLRILWTGAELVGAPTDVDVVIAAFDASAASVSTLLATTVRKPFDGLSVGDSVDVPVDLRAITLDDGDSILISARGQDVLSGRWIATSDRVTITLVPGPGTAILLGITGVVAAGRRR